MRDSGSFELVFRKSGRAVRKPKREEATGKRAGRRCNRAGP